MKYWIFQNNQVLGPYPPDDLSKLPAFSPESLVCSEGRRGTNMGDWQRAGMVPDLSVALVRAGANAIKTAALAELPPEPTLKDMAVLGTVREKVSHLEDVVLQLQEGLRGKDAELAVLRQELDDKSGEARERRRESEELKRKIAALEERLVSVRQLGETLDRAVAEEKRVEQDVEKQGRTLHDLAHEVEALRRVLEEREAERRAREAAADSAPAPAPAAVVSAPIPAPLEPVSAAPVPADSPSPALSEEASAPARTEPDVPAALERPAPEPAVVAPAIEAAPEAEAVATCETAPPPALGASPAAEPAPEPLGPAKGRKRLAAVGAAMALLIAGGLVALKDRLLPPPEAVEPVATLDPVPLPPPEPQPEPAVPAPAPEPDPRQAAVDLAKEWALPGGKTLGGTLEDLAPPVGNLSPWMAETLAGGRVQVNYFARGTAAGSPTIAYEFEADLESKTLVGRNAAAKSVLAGKTAAPPAPPKAKPVRVRVKKEAASPPAAASGGDAPSQAPPPPAKAAGPEEKAASDAALLDELIKE